MRLGEITTKIAAALSNPRIGLSLFFIFALAGLVSVFFPSQQDEPKSSAPKYQYDSGSTYAPAPSYLSSPPILPSEAESQTASRCTTNSAPPSLSTRVLNFKCNESLFDKGFESCDLDVSYTVTTYCTPTAYSNPRLVCDFEVETHTVDGLLPMRKSETGTKYLNLYDNTSTGTMNMQIRVDNLFEKTYKVKPVNLSCRISDL